eukprot:NODE_12587_length_276_cov_15.339207_g11674_i0.p2 GENE.NODE_12587_length_276_cov_15.339207_g11674_i0~~NODE_12587_length_276_cov_15.339207_g11674_i0.p2  ORF type:complete len:52 (-),score=4.08 NODE_12587_length_276_cov_15.339207_g11674_i0:120-248(-)
MNDYKCQFEQENVDLKHAHILKDTRLLQNNNITSLKASHTFL